MTKECKTNTHCDHTAMLGMFNCWCSDFVTQWKFTNTTGLADVCGWPCGAAAVYGCSNCRSKHIKYYVCRYHAMQVVAAIMREANMQP